MVFHPHDVASATLSLGAVSGMYYHLILYFLCHWPYHAYKYHSLEISKYIAVCLGREPNFVAVAYS